MPQIVTAEETRPHKPRPMLWVVVGVVALVGAVALWFVYQQALKQADEAKYQQMVKNTDRLLQQGKYDDTLREYNGYLTTTKYDTHKDEVAMQIAALHSGKGDHAKALEVYRQLESDGYKDNLAVVKGIADASVGLGDKPTAITYLRRAVELRKRANEPLSGVYIQQYEAAIKNLEAQK